MEFVEIMERVSLVVEGKLKVKPTDAVIAKYLEISPTNFANMKTRNSIPHEKIAYFCAKHNITINWILFNQKCASIIPHEEKYYSLKIIDKINASCGGGSFEFDAINFNYIKIDKTQLLNLGYNSTNNLEAIKVTGDSMYPTLNDKDIILIDRSLIKYNEDSIFLVNTTDGLYVKKLKISDNEIALISENEVYENITFSLDEVTIMGKIIGTLYEN